MSKRHAAACKSVPLTYWSPSAGNLLSSVVWSMAADLRLRTDAVKVLRLVSKSSRDEIADIIGEEEDGSYRAMSEESFAGLRAEAIEIVIRCIEAAPATNNGERPSQSAPQR
jgi:hypothetical protein